MLGENKGNNMGSFNVSAMGATTATTSGASKFTRVINWCLALLVFASPLLFLPFTSEALEFNKQTFIFLMVMVVLGVWVIRILTTRSVSWVKTPLDYILLAYLIVYLVASFLSLDQVSSFLGYYGRFVGSFMSVLSLIVLYYIVVNNVRSERVTRKLMDVLMLSGGIVLIYSVLQMFGVYILRFNFAKATSFNPVGSMVSLAIFAALMILFVQWSWLTRETTKLKNIFYLVVTLVGLFIIFAINSFTVWLVLALAMMAFLAIAMITKQEASQTWVWKPLLILVVAILFVGFNFLPRSVNPRAWVGNIVKLPVEIQLSNSANWEMVRNALSEKPILGFGPGTTAIAFGQIKPDNINQSVVWSLNFDRSSSEITNIIIETGLLGLIAFEATAILFLFYAIFFILKRTDHPGRNYAFGLFIVWLALYITHFFYFFNTTLSFMYWLTLALFVAVAHWREGSDNSNMSMSESPRSALSWMFASLLILAVLLIGGFFQVAVYFADTAFASGIRELSKQEPNLERSGSLFLSAISRNQYRDAYYLAYGQNIVYQAAQEIRKDNADLSKIQGWVRNLVEIANAATNISPNKASNWSARVAFFNQIRALSVPGADDAIVSSAEEAVKRDPKSPVYQMQLAQAYVNASETIDPSIVAAGTDTDGDGLGDQAETDLGSNPQDSDSNANGVSDGDEVKAGFNPAGNERLTAAQRQKYTKIDQDKLRRAEEALKQAITLKSNLADAYISLGRLYERWNKLADAEKSLLDGTKAVPANINLVYELGRVQFNLKNYTEAEKQFNRVIRVVPDHANAHYSLGLVYIQKNDKTKALAEFERTLQITGSNKALEDLINSLKNPTPTPTPTPGR